MSDITTSGPTAGSPSISRRTLAAGAAWAVPVIAMAGAAPAYAASGNITLVQTRACKSPGNSCETFPKGYKFTFSTTNTYACSVTVTSASIVVTSGSAPGTLTVATPFVVPQGTTPTLVIQVNATNSANSTFTATMTLNYVDCDNLAKTSTTAITVASTPPDCTCPPAGSAGRTAAVTSAAETTAAETPAPDGPGSESPVADGAS